MRFVTALWPIVRDFLSTIVFVSFIWLTGNVIAATWIGIATGIVQTVWMLANHRRIAPLQWISLGLVVTLGTTTILTHNGFFFKLKSSIVAIILAVLPLRYEWMEPYLPRIVTENLDRVTITHAGRAWTILLLAIAVLNIVVALTCSDRIWASFIIAVPFLAYCLLFSLQYRMFHKQIAVSIASRRMHRRHATVSGE